MNLIREIISLFIPACCHVCHKEIPDTLHPDICPLCMAELPRTYTWMDKTNIVYARVAYIPQVLRAASWFYYTPQSKYSRVIQAFKYEYDCQLAYDLGEAMAYELLPTGFLTDIDLICPVPLHFIKWLRRTYNQSEEISRGISKVTGICISKRLKAKRHHRTQTALSHEERRLNVEHLFRFDAAGMIPNPTILIVDDVCTTGATVAAAAKAIAETLPKAKIVILTLTCTY